MGVEIHILSGSRQGRQLELELDEFRVGGEVFCDVFFDPAADPAAKDRAALLQRTEEGWYIRNVGGGELLLNEQAVSGRMRIRSGDIVRLSDRGPDFSFEIVPAKMAIRDGLTAGQSPPAKAAAPAASDSNVTEMPPATISVIAATDVLQSGVTAESTLAPLPPPRRESNARTFFLVAGALGSILLLSAIVLLALFATRSHDAASDAVAAAAKQQSKTPETTHPTIEKPPLPISAGESQSLANTPSGDAEKQPPAPPADIAQSTPATAPQADPKDFWETVARRFDKTIWLIEVGDEQGKFVYPFATAFAVGEHVLATTASVAEELNKFRAKGWKISATNAALNKAATITAIRIHAVHADLAGDRERGIYVDLAVLDTLESLGDTVSLATEEELAALDTGAELACVGISHSGDAIKPDDVQRQKSLAPEAFCGQLFLRTMLDPKSPSSPRLLHFKSQLGENMYGSPIVDRNGRVVAVFAETAAGGEGKHLGLNYAPMLDPALIRMAVEGKDDKFWIKPNQIDISNEPK